MKNLLSEKAAAHALLIILSLVTCFHLLVITDIIPYEVVWGGRLKNFSQMLVFELVSISINLLMLTVVGLRAGYLKLRISTKLVVVCLWFMAGLFLLNTLGNLFSVNEFEKMVFTPLTLLLAVLSAHLALGAAQKTKRPS